MALCEVNLQDTNYIACLIFLSFTVNFGVIKV